MDLLPYDYKLPDDFDKSYAKFKRFVSWDGDMMKLNYVRFGKYMICNKHKLDDADLKAFVKMDVLLEMINEEMRNLIIKAETETICENKVQKTVDIHPPKTGISVHFSDSFILMALQI